jgi:hypothetical protein
MEKNEWNEPISFSLRDLEHRNEYLQVERSLFQILFDKIIAVGSGCEILRQHQNGVLQLQLSVERGWDES